MDWILRSELRWTGSRSSNWRDQRPCPARWSWRRAFTYPLDSSSWSSARSAGDWHYVRRVVARAAGGWPLILAVPGLMSTRRDGRAEDWPPHPLASWADLTWLLAGSLRAASASPYARSPPSPAPAWNSLCSLPRPSPPRPGLRRHPAGSWSAVTPLPLELMDWPSVQGVANAIGNMWAPGVHLGGADGLRDS